MKQPQLKIQKVFKIIMLATLMLLNAWIIYYFVEAIYWQSYSQALSFVVLGNNISILMLNILIIIIFELSVWLLSNSVGCSFGVTALVCCILAIVNELKMKSRGEAFTFGDISVAKEALLVAGNYGLKISRIDIQIIVLILCLAAVYFVCLPSVFAKKFKLYMVRLTSEVVCIIIFSVLWFNVEDIVELIGGNHYVYVTSAWYDENGLPLGLVRTAPRSIDRPEDYSKETILALQNSVSESYVEKESDDELPNLIFVMNESLYDIDSLEEITFNIDPLVELKKLQKDYTNGYLISPSYGGGTCNVEFEVLTGCSVENIGGINALPYVDMIHQDLSSMVSLLNSRGYKTTSFHPNTGTYFNRRNVYEYMQFDEIYFTEEMGELEEEGTYASDTALYEKVIQAYEENESSGSPFFSYIITMQNHGGYDYQYNEYGINVVENTKCTNEQALQTFANLEYSSIEAFTGFIDYFDNISEPTIIVMFGDHSPGLGSIGYQFESSNVTGELEYRTTPLVVWSNYDLPYEEWEYINAYNLAAKVFEYANIEMDEFFLYGLKEENVPTLGEDYYIDKTWKSGKDVIEFANYKQKLWSLAYDRIFGKDYGSWNNE